MVSAPDDAVAHLTRAASALLRALVAAAVTCLVLGLIGRALAPAARWPRGLVLAGTGIVVAAPLLALGRIAWSAPTRRVLLFAIGGIVITVLGAILAA